MLHEVWVDLDRVQHLVLADVLGHGLHKTTELVLDVRGCWVKLLLTFVVLIAESRLGGGFLRRCVLI